MLNEINERDRLLDGVRGLAVVLVVVYHFYPSIYLGGYSGVDIFFMLSGYLITKSIVLNYQNNSLRFDFYKFYYSRILRIFPILLVVIFSVVILSLVLLEPHELKVTARHAVYSTLQVLNYILWFEDGYFGLANNLKVFLHLWSLSVEWQIYLIAPIIILLLIKLFGLTVKMGMVVLFVSIFGMLSFVYAATHHPVGTYFFTPLRMWAFFWGASLFLLRNNKIFYNFCTEFKYTQLNRLLKFFHTWLFFIIAILIGVAVLILPKYLNYSYINIISVLVVSLLIVFGQRGALSGRMTRVVGSILVWLGVISLSIYLWHWPLLYFIRILNWDNSSVMLLIGILFTLMISYNYIEKPCNVSSNKKRSVILVFVSAVFLISLCLLVIMKTQNTIVKKICLLKIMQACHHLIMIVRKLKM